ncbi:MAG: DUF2752 domain-containing protein [Planctomycetota bacterium]
MKVPDLSFVFARSLFWICAAVIAASVVLNPDGYGVSLCVFKQYTGVDCFGCGMTRGVTSITHLRFESAWHYHPFAFLFWPAAVLLALGVIPPVGRAYLRWRDAHTRGFNAFLWVGLVAFVTYGLARMIAQVS